MEVEIFSTGSNNILGGLGMKNFTKLLTVLAGVALCAIILAVPAKAMTAEDAANKARWEADQRAHTKEVTRQLAAYNAENAANMARWVADRNAHEALFAQQVANNAKETARIKKEIVTNYTELSKFNPAFKSMIAPAVADYEKAMAAAIAAQVAADALK